MNSTERKREALKKVFRGRKWQYKVNHMRPDQVIAIWYALHLQKKV